MIQLIEAPPRSGKSYFAVNYLCKFIEYDDLYNEYVLDNKVLIISNIEGLKIRHWKLEECLKKKSIEEFFSIDNFENIMEKTGKNHVILAIDECHEIFPAGYVNNKVYEFFAYHGHIGLDVILMCQSLERTSRMFNPLLEFVVKVTPRSRAIMNNFSYRYVDVRGRYLYSKSLRKRPLVFNAYKSFRKDEHNKPKNAVKHWIVISVVFLGIAGFCFKGALALVKGKSESGKKHTEIAQKRLQPASASNSAINPPVAGSVSAAVPDPIQAVYSSGQKTVDKTFASRVPVVVVGRAASGKEWKYLLTNGKIVTSRVHYAIGDDYNE